MATLKRTDSKAFSGEPPPPKRFCVACTESEDDFTDTHLMRPCRVCETDYCMECISYMFLTATKDSAAMPPKCCSLIQLHVVQKHLRQSEVRAFKEKFEQWITPNKTYCPVQACSAFIPEKRVPDAAAVPALVDSPTLSSVLGDVVKKVWRRASSRFFRGEMDITQLPGYSAVVKQPMDLSIIQDKIGKYKTIGELTNDVTLIHSNAVEYNGGSQHPVSIAAADVVKAYRQEIFALTDRLIPTTPPPTPPPALFACPECHVAICTTCKQVEHTGSPCDTSNKDHEMAMLQQFGYKQCPRCNTAVKKMFGCSHMQCVCGAHWCWWCRHSLEKCLGNCDEMRGDSEDEEEDYDSEDEVPDSSLDENANISDSNGPAGSQAPNRATGHTTAIERTQPPEPIISHAAELIRASTQNLDAGGGRVWDNEAHDFGAEPDDEPFAQVWSCQHNFQTHKAPIADGFDRGDFDKIECNRCFLPVSTHRQPSSPAKPAPKKQRRFVDGNSNAIKCAVAPTPTVDAQEKEPAWECLRCKLVVCIACRDKYQVEKQKS